MFKKKKKDVYRIFFTFTYVGSFPNVRSPVKKLTQTKNIKIEAYANKTRFLNRKTNWKYEERDANIE